MKECERISDLFGELHDGQADPDYQRLAMEHFHACPICREEYKWYNLTVRALTKLQPVAPPKDFIAQLNVRLFEPPPTFSYRDFLKGFFSSSPYVPLPVGLAALSLIVVIGLVAYNNSPLELLGPIASIAEMPAEKSGAGVALSGDTRPTGQPHRLAPEMGPRAATPKSIGPSSSSAHLVASHPLLIPKASELPTPIPTVADVIGADNLTVESPSVEQAIESVKKILPNIRGRVVEEYQEDRIGGAVVGVLIPPSAYGRLTSELVNHGAIAIGAGTEAGPKKADADHVLLYIRFVRQ